MEAAATLSVDEWSSSASSFSMGTSSSVAPPGLVLSTPSLILLFLRLLLADD